MIADYLPNPNAPHFAGRLLEPWPSSQVGPSWIMTAGFPAPRSEKTVYVEDEDWGLPRWERRR